MSIKEVRANRRSTRGQVIAGIAEVEAERPKYPDRYTIHHGGTVQIEAYETLEEAYTAAFRIQCAKPVKIMEKTGPNSFETVLTITREAVKRGS